MLYSLKYKIYLTLEKIYIKHCNNNKKQLMKWKILMIGGNIEIIEFMKINFKNLKNLKI